MSFFNSTTEVNVGITCASVPALRSLARSRRLTSSHGLIGGGSSSSSHRLSASFFRKRQSLAPPPLPLPPPLPQQQQQLDDNYESIALHMHRKESSVSTLRTTLVAAESL